MDQGWASDAEDGGERGPENPTKGELKWARRTLTEAQEAERRSFPVGLDRTEVMRDRSRQTSRLLWLRTDRCRRIRMVRLREDQSAHFPRIPPVRQRCRPLRRDRRCLPRACRTASRRRAGTSRVSPPRGELTVPAS